MRRLFSKLNIWPDFTASLVSILLSVSVLFCTLFFDIDLFEFVITKLSHLHFENHEIDEFILPIVLILLGGTVDLVLHHLRDRRQHMLNAERLRAMRSTMATVDDIVNNLLNNLGYLRFLAERNEPLNEEALKQLDKQIKLTTEKINTIKGMKKFIDKDLGHGLKCINLDDGPK